MQAMCQSIIGFSTGIIIIMSIPVLRHVRLPTILLAIDITQLPLMQLIVPSCAIGKELCTSFVIQVFVLRGSRSDASSVYAILDDERSEFESIFH